MSASMKRRMFLRTAAGGVLAIPFLPSLLTRTFAADPVPTPGPKHFFAIGTEHGDVWSKNMYPDEGLLTQSQSYAGRTVRYGALPVDGGDNGIVHWSPVCRASAQVMTPTLAAKFNVLRGLDIPYKIGHHEGAHLGNYASTDLGLTGGIADAAYATATIDQIMAYSPNFYTPTDLSSLMTQRSFCVGNGTLSWNFTSPATRAGRVVKQPYLRENKVFFDYLFKPSQSFGGVDTIVVDHIKESYERLRKHPRLSSADRLRLDVHLERMAEIERKLGVSAGLTPPDAPTEDAGALASGADFLSSPEQNRAYCGLMNDIIVQAFSAGVSRIGTWGQSIKFSDQVIHDWHGNVGHQGLGAAVAQQWTVGWNQGTFEHVMVDLAAKLDTVITADGTTLLDNSLIQFTSEAGQVSHHTGCVNYPVVTAGGAGGYFKTGMFVDFANQNVVYDDLDVLIAGNSQIRAESPGLYYQQFLANALMAMGIPASEWEHFTEYTGEGPSQSSPTKGYGFHFVESTRADDYTQAKAVMGDKLPVITG